MKRPKSSGTRASSNSSPSRRSKLDPEIYARLQAEAKAPYRSLRRFIYLAFGSSGLIGGFIFLTQLVSGPMTQASLGNFALQAGVVALMIYLFRIDRAR